MLKATFLPILFLFSTFSSSIYAQQFRWAKQFGAQSTDLIQSIATDESGNVYISGTFRGTVDFDPDTTKTTERTATNGPDLFVSKLNKKGELIWVMTTEGASDMRLNQMQIDSKGEVYLTGGLAGFVDFDPPNNGHLVNSWAGLDVFVCKLDRNGTLEWVHVYGDYAPDPGDGH